MMLQNLFCMSASHTTGKGRNLHVPPARNAACWCQAGPGAKGWRITIAQIGSKEPLDIPEAHILGDIEGIVGKLST